MDSIAPVTPLASCDAIPTNEQAGGLDLRSYLAGCGSNASTVDALGIDARASALGDPVSLGGQLLSALEGFQARVNAIDKINDAMLGQDRHIEMAHAQQRLVGPAEIDPRAGGSGIDGLADAREPLIVPSVESAIAVMERSFDFAIQSALVVRIATQLTGSVNTLLRGQ